MTPQREPASRTDGVTSTSATTASTVAARTALIGMAVVVLAWGAGPPVTKLVTAPPLVGAMARFAMSVPLLFLILLLQRRRMSWSMLRNTALPGISFGINMIFVFAALQEATVAVLSTSVAIQPALLLVIASPLFGERPTLKQVAWTVLGIMGAGIVILGAGPEVRASALGVGYALLALATFSVYFVLTRIARSRHEVDPIEWMAGVNVWALIAVIPPALVLSNRGEFAQFGGVDWLWITIVAWLTGVTGHVAMSWVHGYIETARSSLYLLAMHPVALTLAWLIHDEPITWIQLLGGVVLLGSVVAVIRLPARLAKGSGVAGTAQLKTTLVSERPAVAE